MRIPKWLLPVISVIAAVAVGVALSIVGAQFASKRVVEKAAGTVTERVLQPVASGLTKADLANLSPSMAKAKSAVTGTVTAVRKASKSVNPPLNREVEFIASGGQASSSSTPAPSVSAVGTATPHPDASSLSVTPYQPGPSQISANDPCAISAGSSCPDGLHSVILALTAPPAPDFAIEPFEAPCTPTTTAEPRFENRSNVQVTLSSTVPMSYSVHFQSDPGLGETHPEIVHGIASATTDPGRVSDWDAAREADTPVASLPPLTGCVSIPLVWSTGSLQLDVTGTSSDGTVIAHSLVMNPSGPGTPGPIHVQPYGTDAFVAYGDAPSNQRLEIDAYVEQTASDGDCNNVDGLETLDTLYQRTDFIDQTAMAELADPPDYNTRTAYGFGPPPGSVILLCGHWYHSRGSASYDRTTPIRTSQLRVGVPDLIGQLYFDDVYDQFTGDIGHLRGDITRVQIDATFDDGSPCGSFTWTPDTNPVDLDESFCLMPPTETINPSLDGFTDVPPNGDINIHVTVFDIVSSGGTSAASSDWRLNNNEPICPDCTDAQLSHAAFQLFQVGLPDPGHGDGYPGGIRMHAGWTVYGTSGTPSWQVSTPYDPGAPENALDDNPAPNTDVHLVVDTTRTTPSDLTARLDYSANAAGSYVLTLLNASGGAPCTVDGSTSVVVSGDYPTARAVVPIYIPHLCHGTAYVGVMKVIHAPEPGYPPEDAGYTLYGYHGDLAWPGLALITPWVPVDLVYHETVIIPAGSALTDFSLSLDGVDIDPSHDVVSGCHSDVGPLYMANRVFPSLASKVQLHLQYRMRHITSAPSAPCTFPTTDVAPLIDAYQTVDLDSVLSHPEGVEVTTGPVTILLQATPAS